MPKKPAASKSVSKKPAKGSATLVAKPVTKVLPVKAAKPAREAEPMQFEFGKLLDVVEKQVAKAPVKAMKPDAATRAAIEAVVRKESELIRKAMRKQGRNAAWVRQQWKALKEDAAATPPSGDCTPVEYADRVRLADQTVPPPGPVRTRLLEAGRKLRS